MQKCAHIQALLPESVLEVEVNLHRCEALQTNNSECNHTHLVILLDVVRVIIAEGSPRLIQAHDWRNRKEPIE